MTPAFLARAEATIAEANRQMATGLIARADTWLDTPDALELLLVAAAQALCAREGPAWTATTLEDMAEDLREECERRAWEAIPVRRHRRRVANMRELVEEAIA
jgi:hypothetical protein